MPDEGVTAWDDAVRGRVEFPNEKLEDVVLVRGDGRPTYNFASPMEDVWDEITHVIRAEDHISNTPKQINIIRAVGAELPVYAHVPNVNGADGKKLSKRHGATGVDEFRKAGYLPDALVNFLALLGWAPDGETTIMSRDELIERFSLERVTPSPAQFDYAKLDWMNGMYIRALPEEEFAHALILWLGEQGYDWDAVARAQGGAARAGEARAARGVPGVRALPLRGRAARPGGARRRRAGDRRGARRARRARAVHGGVDRGGAPRGARAARPEAAAGLPADPRRGDRLEGVAGSLREHRAARTRDDARAPQRGRFIGSGFGGASGSSARWNSRHARRRNCIDGDGSASILVRVPPAHELARVARTLCHQLQG